MGVKIEEALGLAGNFGRWHWGVVALASIPGLFFVWHKIGLIFVAGIPDHWCHVQELEDAGWTTEQIKTVAIPSRMELGVRMYDQCQMYQRNYTALAAMDPSRRGVGTDDEAPLMDCPSWDYDSSTFHTTIVTEWELYCSRLHIVSTLHSVYPLGVLCGSLFAGPLADTYGRRRCALVATMSMITLAIASVTFSVGYAAMGALRFFLGWTAYSIYVCCYTLVAELCPPEKRTSVTFAFDILFAVGQWSVGIVAYLVRDWRALQMAYSLPSLSCGLLYWFLPESPRWLLVKGRRAEAQEILLKAARWNGSPPPDQDLMKKMMEATKDEEVIAATSTRSLLSRLSRIVTVFVLTKEMRRRSVVIFFCWFIISLTSYGIIFHFAKLPFNLYMTHIINGIVICLCKAALVIWPVPDMIGRKKSLMVCFVSAGLAGLLILAVPTEWEWLSVTLSLMTSTFLSLPFTLVYLYTAELFPTEVRNASLTTGSVFARLGGIVSPYLTNYLYGFHYAIPTAVFGGTAALTALACSFLPETRGRRLPETVAELESDSSASW